MSLNLSLQFPTGRYVAAAWHDKESVEWPPHPARFCLGLIDALHRAGNPNDEREALRWLCRQGAPSIVIPEKSHIDRQVLMGIYVPQNVNKDSLDHPRKERAFPTVFLDPEAPAVFFRWPDADPPREIRESLSRLVSRAPRFGHSSSMVIATLGLQIDLSKEWTILEPIPESDSNQTPEHLLRIPWEGILESAEAAFDSKGRTVEREQLVKTAALAKKATKPPASSRSRHDPSHRWAGYVEASAEDRIIGPWSKGVLVLEQVSGSRLGIQSTWQITEVLHKAILDRWSRDGSLGPVPSWISGHAANSTEVAKICHLAIFPLSHVGSKHADGHLLGLGIALPDPQKLGIDPGELRIQWQKALGTLFDGDGMVQLTPKNKTWSARFAPLSSPKPKLALKPQRWTRPARIWQSVTPVILHRHPKPRFEKDPEKWKESCRNVIRQCCEHLGLPEPVRIEPALSSSLNGVPPSPGFVAPKQRASRPPRFHIHVKIEFPDPVTGPLLVGAGRYRGYGLFLPVEHYEPT